MTDDDKLIDANDIVDEDELDRRVRELGLDQTPSIEHAKEEAKKIDDEFQLRLDALEKKAQAHKDVRDSQKRDVALQAEKDRESAVGLGVGLSIAYTIIGCPILGLIIGYLIDGSLGTTTYKGIGVGAGSILGIAMSFFLYARTNRKP